MKAPFLLGHKAAPATGAPGHNRIEFPWPTGWLCSAVQIHICLTPLLASGMLSDLVSLRTHGALAGSTGAARAQGWVRVGWALGEDGQ